MKGHTSVRGRPVLALVALLLATVFFLGGATPASADTGEPSPPAPSAPLTDSSGIPLEAYKELPIDRGGWTFNQDKMFWAKPIDLLYGAHFDNATNAIEFNKWNSEFTWVDWISGPGQVVSTGFESFTSKIPWQTFVGTLAAIVVVFLLWRGRSGAGWSELLISTFLLALATTVLVNPVATVTGPGGAIEKTKTFAQSTQAEILNGTRLPDGSKPTEVVNAQATQPMGDVFVRYIYQATAFGKVIDGNPACKEAFDKVMKEVKVSNDSTGEKIRNAVKGCDQGAADAASNPNVGTLLNLGTGGFASWQLYGFVTILGALMLLAIVVLLWEAIKMIWNAKAGVVAGAARGALIRSLLMGGFSVVFVVLAMVGTSLFMVLIRMVFANRIIADNSFMVWRVMDWLFLFAIVGLIYLWVKGRKGSNKLADKLRKLGAGSPARQPVDFKKAFNVARDIANHRLLKNAAKGRALPQGPGPNPTPTPAPTSTSRPSAAPGAAVPGNRTNELGAAPPRKQLPPGPDRPNPGLPGGPDGPSPVGSGPQGKGGPGGHEVIQGEVLSEKRLDLKSKKKLDRRERARQAVRFAAQFHPVSRAAVTTIDVASQVRNKTNRPSSNATSRTERELHARLYGGQQPLPYKPVSRNRT
ncbi:hypothetical protein [Arthrobacter woluwensis]|uniref:hypothetical protein n=1 Tax=Arthrobacter woluwensis TaxID=156980 RepID=UPI0038298B72